MGYTTKFTGELRFGLELKASELAYIKELFEVDDVEKGDWIKPEGEQPHYIQFELTPDFGGIQWDGSEKFYNAVGAVNFIIVNARRKIPDFCLTGHLLAAGEDVDDKWSLVIENGLAKEVRTPPKGHKITCPHCDEDFYYGDESDD